MRTLPPPVWRRGAIDAGFFRRTSHLLPAHACLPLRTLWRQSPRPGCHGLSSATLHLNSVLVKGSHAS